MTPAYIFEEDVKHFHSVFALNIWHWIISFNWNIDQLSFSYKQIILFVMIGSKNLRCFFHCASLHRFKTKFVCLEWTRMGFFFFFFLVYMRNRLVLQNKWVEPKGEINWGFCICLIHHLLKVSICQLQIKNSSSDIQLCVYSSLKMNWMHGLVCIFKKFLNFNLSKIKRS